MSLLKAVFWLFSGTIVIWATILVTAIALIVIPRLAVAAAMVVHVVRVDWVTQAAVGIGVVYYGSKLLS